MCHLNVKIKTFSRVLKASKMLFVASQFGFRYAALGTADHIASSFCCSARCLFGVLRSGAGWVLSCWAVGRAAKTASQKAVPVWSGLSSAMRGADGK